MAEHPSTPVVEHPKRGADVQDPSPLVIQMVQREIAQLEARRISELEGLRREIITRIEAMDKALRKAEEYPTAIDLESKKLQEYFAARLEGVYQRLADADKLAALQHDAGQQLALEQRTSSERAISKAEASVEQQLEAQMRQIRDLKERMDKEEGKTAGVVAFWGVIVAVVMIAGSIVAIVATLLTQG